MVNLETFVCMFVRVLHILHRTWICDFFLPLALHTSHCKQPLNGVVLGIHSEKGLSISLSGSSRFTQYRFSGRGVCPSSSFATANQKSKWVICFSAAILCSIHAFMRLRPSRWKKNRFHHFNVLFQYYNNLWVLYNCLTYVNSCKIVTFDH